MKSHYMKGGTLGLLGVKQGGAQGPALSLQGSSASVVASGAYPEKPW